LNPANPAELGEFLHREHSKARLARDGTGMGTPEPEVTQRVWAQLGPQERGVWVDVAKAVWLRFAPHDAADDTSVNEHAA